ncbi:MAG TPA: VanZ family protein [Candidatus Limnocylindrales bacterium]|nr:VanZ family protein [Candidatus Limnocylindrales bacterium]
MEPYKFKQKALDWLILILYTGIVYATLYHARLVSTFLRQRLGSWYSPFVNIFILAMGTFFLIQMGQKRWTSYLFLVPIFGIYVYLFKQLPLPEERIHFLEYGVMGYLSLRALAHTFPPPSLYLWAVGLTFLLGWIDEGIQGLLPNRIYDIRDVFMNGLSGILGILVYKILLNPNTSPHT